MDKLGQAGYGVACYAGISLKNSVNESGGRSELLIIAFVNEWPI